MKEKHCTELGLLLVQFQNLEQTIAFFAVELISQDQTLGNILISKMSFRIICEMFATLFNYRCKNTELNKELKGILKRINAIEDKRNSYVHSTWGFPATSLGEGTLRIKRKIKKNVFSFDLEVLKENDIRITTQEISKIIDEFFDLMRKLNEKGFLKFSEFVKM